MKLSQSSATDRVRCHRGSRVCPTLPSLWGSQGLMRSDKPWLPRSRMPGQAWGRFAVHFPLFSHYFFKLITRINQIYIIIWEAGPDHAPSLNFILTTLGDGSPSRPSGNYGIGVPPGAFHNRVQLRCAPPHRVPKKWWMAQYTTPFNILAGII